MSASRPGRLLLICYGNLCRSPMAQALMQLEMGDGWSVESAGTHAFAGQPPTRQAQRAMRTALDIDIGWQRSMPLTAGAVARADWTFAMTRAQAAAARALAPEAADRVILFGAFAPAEAAGGGRLDPDGGSPDVDEIADPMGCSDAEYHRCLERLAHCAAACADWLRAGSPRDGSGAVTVPQEHAESDR